MNFDDFTPQQFEQFPLDERIKACRCSGIDTEFEVVEKYNASVSAFEGRIYSVEELVLLRLFYFRSGFFVCVRYNCSSLSISDIILVTDYFAFGIIEAEVNLGKLGY